MKEKLIEKYFLEQLSSDEEVLFQKMLAEDEAFKETVEFETSVRKVTRSTRRDALKEKLADFEATLDADSSQGELVDVEGNDKQRSTRGWKIFAIAASIAFITAFAWVFFIHNGLSNEELFAANYEVYPNTVYNITRGDSTGDGTGDNGIKGKAFTLYEQGNYKEAISAFQSIKQTTSSTDINFYKAQAMIASGEYEGALSLLKSMKNSKYEAEALWYQSLVALKVNDKEEAIISLRELISKGSYKKRESEQLLEALE